MLLIHKRLPEYMPEYYSAYKTGYNRTNFPEYVKLKK